MEFLSPKVVLNISNFTIQPCMQYSCLGWYTKVRHRSRRQSSETCFKAVGFPLADLQMVEYDQSRFVTQTLFWKMLC